MLNEEYNVKMTVDGRFALWQSGVQEYLASKTGLVEALVEGALAIHELADTEPYGQDIPGLAAQWREDADLLSPGEHFMVTTKLARRGSCEPVYREEVDE